MTFGIGTSGGSSGAAELVRNAIELGRGEVVLTWPIDHDIPVPVTGMPQQLLRAYRHLDLALRNQEGRHRLHWTDEDEERR